MDKNKNKREYLEDTIFFTIWMYLNGERLHNNRDHLGFDDIAGTNTDLDIVVIALYDTIKKIGLKNIQGLNFDNEMYDRFSIIDHQKMLEAMQEYNLTDVNNSFQAILENKFTFNDMWKVLRQFPKIVYYFYFDTKLEKETYNKLNKHIKDYLKDFTEDKLYIDDKNYWLFERQKKATMSALLARQEKYGNDFIIEYPTQNRYGRSLINNEYLFIHTLCTLEHLEYIEIEKVWVNQYTEGDKQKFYRVKIHLNKKFFKEKESEKIIKLNPVIEKKSKLFFDEKNNQLCNSNGKRSQSIKGSPLRLLRCFLKNKQTLRCKKSEIIKTMGGQDQYSGARRQLLSLINEVADIDSIHNKNNKKVVEYYQLKEL